MATEYTSNELMAVRAAGELHENEVVFVGIGLPNLACNIAKASHAPNLFMIYESGAVGTIPTRVPVSIGDPTLVTDSLSIVSQADIFQTYLQAGLIEVGFLGGAQIDRFGNINTTVIGNYENPKVRLPGSGGACEIAVHSQRLLVMMKMSNRTFVEKVDFITSPGHKYVGGTGAGKSESRKDFYHPGQGPSVVVTDLGVWEFQGGEMTFVEIFPSVTKDMVQKACGWQVRFAPTLRETPKPDAKVLDLIRKKLDPQGLFLGKTS